MELKIEVKLAIILIALGTLIQEAYGIEVICSGGDAGESSSVAMNIDAADAAIVDGQVTISGADIRPMMSISGPIPLFEQYHGVTDSTGKNANVYVKVVNAPNGLTYDSLVLPNEGTVNAQPWVSAEQWLTVPKADSIQCRASAAYQTLSSNIGFEEYKGSLSEDYVTLNGYYGKAYTSDTEIYTSQTVTTGSGGSIKIYGKSHNDKGDAETRIDVKGSLINSYSGSANAISSKAYGFQDLIISGDNIYALGKSRSADHDKYAQVTLDSSKAQNMHVELSSLMFSKSGDAEIAKAFIESKGKADYAKVQSAAEYYPLGASPDLGNYAYDSWSSGSWKNPGDGDLSASAKTVKAAVTDVEMTTNSDSIEAWTQAYKAIGNGAPYNSWSVVDISALQNYVSGDISGFETHLYSYAYPENNHHDKQELVSTASTGVKGTGITTTLNRGYETSWGVYQDTRLGDYFTKPYQNFRATDITVIDPISGSIARTSDNLWKVPGRPTTKNPQEKVPWGIKTMYNNDELKKTSGGRGVDVAVIDTGVDTLHPDLVMRMEDYADENGAVEYGSEKDSQGNYKADPDGHGTHVCGTIVADGGFDNKGIWGMAPEADLHVYKYDDPVSAIYRATDLGVDIISMSWHGSNDLPSLQNAVDYATSNGVLLVAASGNGLASYPDKKWPMIRAVDPDRNSPVINFPAAFPNVIAVGAVNSKGNAVWWTSPGYNNNDGIINPGEVMFGAPGVNVQSTWPTYGIYDKNDRKLYSWYKTMDGTSMATPHISGLAAKILSDSFYKGYTGADTKEIMQNYAVDVTGVQLDQTASIYKPDIKNYEKMYSGSSPGIYYNYILQNIGSWMRPSYPNFLIGEDCLTGLGIPKLPKGST